MYIGAITTGGKFALKRVFKSSQFVEVSDQVNDYSAFIGPIGRKKKQAFAHFACYEKERKNGY